MMATTKDLIKNTDSALHAKFQKIKLFKSYFHEKTQVNVDRINKYKEPQI